MARDDSKLAYYSGWDIDQLIASNTVAVGSGDTTVYTIPAASVALPDFKVQFKPTGSAYWFEAGTSSTDGTVAHEFTFSAYILSGQVFIRTTTAGTARYFVWVDKVDY